jgi:hypothetical protein
MNTLARYTLVVTKDKSGTDNAQVPADATVDFYKQGATVTTGVTVPDGGTGVTITVRSSVRIVAGDTLRKGLNASPTVTVVSVTPTTVVVNSDSNGAMVLVAGDRLMVTTARPAVYKESTGIDSYPSSQVVTDATTGVLLPAYLKEPFFDAAVSGTGVAGRLLSDQPGGVVHAIYDVRDYSSVQAALDVMAARGPGGVLLLPAGTLNEFTTPAFTGIVVRSPGVTIKSEGQATLKLQGAGYNNTDLIRLEAGSFSLEDVALLGPNTVGTGVGIRDIGKTPGSMPADRAIVGHSFRRVAILSTASWGIELLPSVNQQNPNGGIWDIELTNVSIYDAKSGGSFKAGLTGESCVQITCINCDFNGPGFDTYGTGMSRGAVYLENATNIAFYNCFFQPQNFSTAVSIFRGNNIHIQDAHFESGLSLGDQEKWWITTAGGVTRLIIDCCHVSSGAHTQVGPRLLKTDPNGQLQDAVMRDCSIGHLEASLSTDDIVLGNSNDGILLMNNRVFNLNSGVARELAYTDLPAVGLVLGQAPFWQQRIPGVSSSSVVTRPTDGTMIWDSTAHKLMVYENGVWRTVQTLPGLLLLTKSADQSTVGAADVADLTVALSASEVIHFHAYLIASTTQTGTGIQMAVNGPGGIPANGVDATIIGWNNAGIVNTGVNAPESYQTNASSAGARRVFEIYGRLINGLTAGTFALRFKSETTTAVTVHRGSWMQYFKGAN